MTRGRVLVLLAVVAVLSAGVRSPLHASQQPPASPGDPPLLQIFDIAAGEPYEQWLDTIVNQPIDQFIEAFENWDARVQELYKDLVPTYAQRRRSLDGVADWLVEGFGERYLNEGYLRDALPYLERARELYEAAVVPPTQKIGYTLLLLGQLHAQGGELLDGIPLLQRGLQLYESAPEVDPLVVAKALTRLGRTYYEADIQSWRGYAMVDGVYTVERAEGTEYSVVDSIPVLERAAQIYTAPELAPDDVSVAETFWLLGTSYSFLETPLRLSVSTPDSIKAVEEMNFVVRYSFERVLAILETTTTPHHEFPWEIRLEGVLATLGSTYLNSNDFVAAKSALHRALNILDATPNFDAEQQRVAGPEPERRFKPNPDQFLSRVLGDLMDVHRRTGNLTVSAAFHRRHLKVLERLVGSDSVSFALGLIRLSTIVPADEALSLLNGALRIYETHQSNPIVAGEGFGGSAIPRLLVDIARAHATLQNFSEAIPVLERSLTLLEAEPDVEPLRLGRTLVPLGWAYVRGGDPARAIDIFHRAVALHGNALADPNISLPPPLGHEISGVTPPQPRLQHSYRFQSALAGLLWSHLMTYGDLTVEASLAKALPAIDPVLNRYATVLFTDEVTGQLYNRRIDDVPATRALQALLIELNNFERNAVHYDIAAVIAYRQLKLMEQATGADSPALAPILSDLGVYLFNLREYDRALTVLLRAVDVQDNYFDLSLALAALADLLPFIPYESVQERLVNDLAELAEQAITAYRQESSDSTLKEPWPLELFATVFQQHEQLTGKQNMLVLPLLEEALNISAEEGRSPVSLQTKIAQQLGVEGRFSDAKSRYELVLELNYISSENDWPAIVSGNDGLGLAHYALNDPQGATRAWLRAEQTARDVFISTIATLPERQTVAMANRLTKQNISRLLTTAGQADRQDVEAIWNVVIRNRPLLFLELSSRYPRHYGDNSETKQAALNLQTARERVADLMVRGARTGNRQVELDAALEVRDLAETRLARVSATYRQEQVSTRVGYAEATATLADTDALVAFATYDAFTPVVGRETSFPFVTRTVPSYLAFVQVGQQSPVVVSLGPAEQLARIVSEWQVQVSRPAAVGRSPTAADERTYREAGVALRALVWDPIVPHLTGANRVFAVPDGSLHDVNLAALPVGSDAYLLEHGPTIHYLANEVDLSRWTDDMPTGGGLLALGAPSYDRLPGAAEANRNDVVNPDDSSFYGRQATCKGFIEREFPSLPGTAREIKEIMDVWTSNPGVSSETVTQLTGAGATERAFKEKAAGQRVLHLATHGFFLSDDCLEEMPQQAMQSSSLAEPRNGLPATPEFTQDGLLSAFTREIQSSSTLFQGENSLLLSGLAFTGANRNDQETWYKEDGVLTAEEVTAMNLSGVEWAVLSACVTAAGADANTTGESLRRAFQAAGVHTLIMSLWDVEDNATQQWMTTLYQERFREGASTVDAVRNASLQMLRERRAQGQTTHPFFWAPFIAVGDWH
jgi:CHAT domain-containing protein/tetratricopeptide (TPR) repeat protein